MITTGDCLEKMKELRTDSVDLVFCSPPYEDARTYDMDYALKGQDWVDWCVPRFLECLRVCKGLVAWVVEGRTRKFRYSATPMLLAADLHRQGVWLRKPPVFQRNGIPGSGGPDWLKNNYEFILCASKGRLPWSDNTAMGNEPKYKPGGAMSYRDKKGRRKSGTEKYQPPKKANPGNVIKCSVGGGRMGSGLAHKNEAPFPESLAEFFIRSFCPKGGVVLDPFCGSGTTLAVSEKTDRRYIGIDIRASQTELSKARVEECL